MAPGQHLKDLRWEDRKQKRWLWLHGNICIAENVWAFVFSEPFSLSLKRQFRIQIYVTIWSTGSWNNRYVALNFWKTKLKIQGWLFSPVAEGDRANTEGTQRFPLLPQWSAATDAELQKTYRWIWLRFICKHTSSPPGSSPETLNQPTGSCQHCQSHEGDELTAEASNG